MFVRQKWTGKYPVKKQRTVPDVVVPLHNDESFTAAGVLTQSTPAGTVTTDQQSEIIVYTGGLPGHTRQGANICYHKKYVRHYSGVPGTPAQVNTALPGGNYTNYYSPHGVYAGSDHTTAETSARSAFGVMTGIGLLQSNAQYYANLTLQKCKPDLTLFSLPNDLIDWKQRKDLGRVWKKGSALVTQLAGAHLNYKFGWKPLVGDLNALVKVVFDLRKRLVEFNEGQGRIISVRHRFIGDSIVKIGNVSYPPYVVTMWRGQLDRTLDGYLVYKPLPVVQMGQIDEKFRMVLASTGFELNPTILWDAIPFSFVVDWFVNVGEFLDQYQHEALELPILVLQTFMQYKERIQTNSWRHHKADANQRILPSVTAGCWSTESTFYRLPYNPDLATFASLKVKWPTLNQAVLGLSLGTVLSAGTINTYARQLAGSKYSSAMTMTTQVSRLARYFESLYPKGI
jgi:hypothetical protein